VQGLARRAGVHSALACLVLAAQPTQTGAAPAPATPTTTPIRHLIVIIGENQSFDSLFATYLAPSGEPVRNLLSEGIVLSDGSPGANFSRALQRRAQPTAHYSIDPPRAAPYEHLPQPTLIGVNDVRFHAVGNAPDARIPADLPDGPFPVSRFVPYPTDDLTPSFAAGSAAMSAATGDPVHRFFQMWQQYGEENRGLDLFAWVAVSTGMGGDTAGVTQKYTGQGGELMGFLNMAAGDAGILRSLANRYAMSDNYHQPIMGGTAINFFALATADLPYFNDAAGAARPPENQIENPDATPGSENFYQRDGYEGGAYVNCSDRASPGAAAILELLARKGRNSGCEPGHFYLVNNYGAGFDLEGHAQPMGPHNYNYPPQSVPTIAEALSAHGVSWKWYTGGRDGADLKTEMRTLHLSLEAARRAQYNDTGDPLVGSSAVMRSAALRARLQGLDSFYRDLRHGTLPAVSFLVPKNLDSGHPGYSVVASYETLLRDIVARVREQPRLWSQAAIIATTDEGGGHFDSGYVQVLDFFGDGPRIPLLVISPYARRGHVDHTYNDHASILKFIERNWQFGPLSARSRDNLPNPAATPADAYVPGNSPAVGDLMTLFEF
jgi:acid phosphatase